MDSRGVVMVPGQTLRSLFEEREPLYGRCADLTVDCSGLTHEQVVERILDALHGRRRRQ
jgi:shikimate kinase